MSSISLYDIRNKSATDGTPQMVLVPAPYCSIRDSTKLNACFIMVSRYSWRWIFNASSVPAVVWDDGIWEIISFNTSIDSSTINAFNGSSEGYKPTNFAAKRYSDVDWVNTIPSTDKTGTWPNGNVALTVRHSEEGIRVSVNSTSLHPWNMIRNISPRPVKSKYCKWIFILLKIYFGSSHWIKQKAHDSRHHVTWVHAFPKSNDTNHNNDWYHTFRWLELEYILE